MSKISSITLDDLLLDRELILFTDWAEMEARERFCAHVDPKVTKLVDFVGWYKLRTEHPCSLSDCHRPHKLGLLLITDTDQEVPIGHMCGTKNFGTDYVRARRTFDLAIIQRAEKQAILKAQHQTSALLDRIESLLGGERGADWISQQFRAFEQAAPQWLLLRLRQRAKRTDSAVYEERRISGEALDIRRVMEGASDDDDEDGEYQHRRVRFEQVLAGNLVGLDILLHSPRFYLLDQLREPLLQLQRLDLNLVRRSSEITRWAKQVAEFEQSFRMAERLIRAGVSFFGPGNFELLSHVALNSSERGELRRLRRYFLARKDEEATV